MFKPKDYRMPDDDERAKLTLLVLELNQLIHRHYPQFRDPESAFFVMSAVAHGCSIGTPFGVSTIAQLTNHSRRKVYAILDELCEQNYIRKGYCPGIKHPVYIRNTNAHIQNTKARGVYRDLQHLFRTLA